MNTHQQKKKNKMPGICDMEIIQPWQFVVQAEIWQMDRLIILLKGLEPLFKHHSIPVGH